MAKQKIRSSEKTLFWPSVISRSKLLQGNNMTWYEKLLDTARDVAPTVAGGAAMAASGGNPALGALVISIVGKEVHCQTKQLR